jgi:hypothetical protein
MPMPPRPGGVAAATIVSATGAAPLAGFGTGCWGVRGPYSLTLAQYKQVPPAAFGPLRGRR